VSTAGESLDDQIQITHVWVGGFKSFPAGSPPVQLAPLTLIYGHNSSGKSSILEVLQLLKQSWPVSSPDQPLAWDGPEMNLGSPSEALHRPANPERDEMTLGLEYAIVRADGDGDGGTTNDEGGLRLKLTGKDIRAGSQRAETISMKISYWEGSIDFVSASPAGGRQLRRPDKNQSTPYLSGLAKAAEEFGERLATDSFPTTVVPLLEDRGLCVGGIVGFEKEDGSARWLLDADDGPNELQWSDGSEWLTSSDLDVLAEAARRVAEQVTRGVELCLASYQHSMVGGSDLDELLRRLLESDREPNRINSWLEVLGVHLRLTTTSGGRHFAFQRADDPRQRSVAVAMLGSGVIRMIEILAHTLSNQPGVFAMDKPETQLHPKLQLALLDFLWVLTFAGDGGNQLLVETHSELMLLRVQLLLAEAAPVDPSRIVAVFVESGPDGSTPVAIRISKDGDLRDPWPGGCFTERVEYTLNPRPLRQPGI